MDEDRGTAAGESKVRLARKFARTDAIPITEPVKQLADE
jgi:hypothetical protein